LNAIGVILFCICTMYHTSMVVWFKIEMDGVLVNKKIPFFSLIQTFNDSGKALSGGKLAIDVSYFGWHIHSETHDLCGETTCPVSVGDFVIAHSQVLPGFTLPVSQCSFHSLYMCVCILVEEEIYLSISIST